MAEAGKTKTESKSYADQALDDAKECDQNMADADAFIKSVEATEQDMAAEHARATQFLASLHVYWFGVNVTELVDGYTN